MKTIVIAWTITTQVYDGKPYAADLGARPGMKTVVEPKAVVWCLDGGDDDVRKANDFAQRENRSLDDGEGERKVYALIDDEDALKTAKRKRMRAVKFAA